MIKNIDLPNPQIWSTAETITVKEFKPIEPTFKGIFVKSDNSQREEIEREIVKTYIFGDGDFVRILSDIGVVDFHWSQIVAFRPVQ